MNNQIDKNDKLINDDSGQHLVQLVLSELNSKLPSIVGNSASASPKVSQSVTNFPLRDKDGLIIGLSVNAPLNQPDNKMKALESPDIAQGSTGRKRGRPKKDASNELQQSQNTWPASALGEIVSQELLVELLQDFDKTGVSEHASKPSHKRKPQYDEVFEQVAEIGTKRRRAYHDGEEVDKEMINFKETLLQAGYGVTVESDSEDSSYSGSQSQLDKLLKAHDTPKMIERKQQKKKIPQKHVPVDNRERVKERFVEVLQHERDEGIKRTLNHIITGAINGCNEHQFSTVFGSIYAMAVVKDQFLVLVKKRAAATENASAWQLLNKLGAPEAIALTMNEVMKIGQSDELGVAALQQFALHIFQMCNKNGDTVEQIQQLTVYNDAKVKQFLLHLYTSMLYDSFTNVWQLVVYCGMHGLYRDMVDEAFAIRQQKWKYSSVAFLPTSNLQPTNYINKPSIEHVLYYAILSHFKSLDAETLKLMFCRQAQFMHHQIFQAFAGNDCTVQKKVMSAMLVNTNSGYLLLGQQVESVIKCFKTQWLDFVLRKVPMVKKKHRIDGSDFSNLCENLILMGQQTATLYLGNCTDLGHMKDQANLKVNRRQTNEEQNKKAMATWLEEERKKQDAEFVNIFTEVHNIAHEAFEKSGLNHYEVNEFQSFITAKLAQDNRDVTFVNLPPGMGKSVVILLTVLLKSKRMADQPKKILILTSTPLLMVQLEQNLGSYLSKLLHVSIACALPFPFKAKEYALVILDECDAWLMNQGLFYKEEDDLRPNGIYDLIKVPQLFCISGTFSGFTLKLLTQMSTRFTKSYQQYNFPSMNQLKQKLSKSYQMESYLYQNQKQMFEAMKTLIQLKINQQPILMFNYLFDDKGFSEWLSGFLLPTQMTVIKSDDDALKLVREKARMTSGLIWLDINYSRGFDAKLGKDAYVMIAASQAGLSLSAVVQMLGRGCRSFGVSQGGYFCAYLQPGQNIDVEAQLKSYEEGDHDLAEMVACYLERWKKNQFSKAERKMLKETFIKSEGGITWRELNTQNQAAVSVLMRQIKVKEKKPRGSSKDAKSKKEQKNDPNQAEVSAVDQPDADAAKK